ncbi:MAG: hypothetical protein KDI13_11335 [Alphaproteobacteria bacterium]|nr:hypothetical protein [Alphaproteobacteria bacterium]
MKKSIRFLKDKIYFLASLGCIYVGTYQFILGVEHDAIYKGGRQSRERIVEAMQWHFDGELIANGVTLLFLGAILTKMAFSKQKN